MQRRDRVRDGFAVRRVVGTSEQRSNKTRRARGAAVPSARYPRYRFVIGMRLSRLDARVVILMPGGACLRLYSARSTSRIVRITSASGSPCAISCSLLSSSSTYPSSCGPAARRAAANPHLAGRGEAPPKGARRMMEAGLVSWHALWFAFEGHPPGPRVSPVEQPVHERLGHVLEDCEPSGEVDVQSRVPKPRSRTCSRW